MIKRTHESANLVLYDDIDKTRRNTYLFFQPENHRFMVWDEEYSSV